MSSELRVAEKRAKGAEGGGTTGDDDETWKLESASCAQRAGT